MSKQNKTNTQGNLNRERLTKLVSFEALGGALMEGAKQEAREVVTRSMVGLAKAQPQLKKVGVDLLKVGAGKLVASISEIEIIDILAEGYAGVNTVKAGYHGYNAITDFVEGYNNATDDEVDDLFGDLIAD